MKEYHKIQTIFKRDPATNMKTLLMGEYSLPEFGYLQNNDWIYTEKVDGTNIRVMYDGNTITFGGKTDNAQIPSPLVKKLQDRFLTQAGKFTEIFGIEPTRVCLYGEGYGAKIQKGGGNYRQDQDFVLFDVKVGDWWLERENVEDVAKHFGIEMVPVIGFGSLATMIEKVQGGFKSTWGDFNAEGIVARPAVDLFNRKGERIITKLKTKDFKNND